MKEKYMKIHNNQKGFGIIEILIIIFVVVVIGSLAWLFFTRLNNNTNNSQDPSLSISEDNKDNDTKPTQPQEINEKIKNIYATKFKFLNIDENNQPQQGEMSYRLSNTSPVYKTESYNFYNNYDGGSTLDLLAGPTNIGNYNYPRPIDTEIRTEIAKTYTDFGLVKTGVYGFGNIGDGNETDVYSGKGLICTIQSPLAQSSSTSSSCGSIEAYKESATKIKPLADVMKNIDSSSTLTNLKINKSLINGYQRAELSQGSIDNLGGSIALFYQKNNEPWVYFTNTQTGIYCSEFNNIDLRSAFKSEPCTDSNNEIVKVD